MDKPGFMEGEEGRGDIGNKRAPIGQLNDGIIC